MILLIASLNVFDPQWDLSRVLRHKFGSLDGARDCRGCGVDGSMGFGGPGPSGGLSVSPPAGQSDAHVNNPMSSMSDAVDNHPPPYC